MGTTEYCFVSSKDVEDQVLKWNMFPFIMRRVKKIKASRKASRHKHAHCKLTIVWDENDGPFPGNQSPGNVKKIINNFEIKDPNVAITLGILEDIMKIKPFDERLEVKVKFKYGLPSHND